MEDITTIPDGVHGRCSSAAATNRFFNPAPLRGVFDQRECISSEVHRGALGNIGWGRKPFCSSDLKL